MYCLPFGVNFMAEIKRNEMVSCEKFIENRRRVKIHLSPGRWLAITESNFSLFSFLFMVNKDYSNTANTGFQWLKYPSLEKTYAG